MDLEAFERRLLQLEAELKARELRLQKREARLKGSQAPEAAGREVVQKAALDRPLIYELLTENTQEAIRL